MNSEIQEVVASITSAGLGYTCLGPGSAREEVTRLLVRHQPTYKLDIPHPTFHTEDPKAIPLIKIRVQHRNLTLFTTACRQRQR